MLELDGVVVFEAGFECGIADTGRGHLVCDRDSGAVPGQIKSWTQAMLKTATTAMTTRHGRRANAA